MSKRNTGVKVREEYEVNGGYDEKGRFWKVEFSREPTQKEIDTFFFYKSPDVCIYDYADDDRIVFVTKETDATWEQAKTRLIEILKEVFGPETQVEFIEKKWALVPGQEVTIQTCWNRRYFKVKFLKRILPEQVVALEEEIIPEGSIENGIVGDIEPDRVKRTGFWFDVESGMEEKAISCVTSALKKILGQDVKITYQHTAEKRKGITVVYVEHKHVVDEEECSFTIRGVPAEKQVALLEILRRIPGFVNIDVYDVYREESGEISIGLESDEMKGDDPYGLAHSKIASAIRDVLGDVKVYKRTVDGDDGKCLGELVFGEGWRENIALTEEEVGALS